MSVTSRTGSHPALEGVRPLRGLRSVAWSLLLPALALSVIGVAAVHSASAELAINYLPRQGAWVLLGLVALMFGALVDYHWLSRIATPLYLSGLAALILILFFGHTAGGARSWVGLAGLGGQPSDYAKLVTAVYLARYLGGVKQEHLDLRKLSVVGLIVAPPMALIALQPDYGGAAMFVPIAGAMVVLAGVRARLVISALLIGVLLSAGVWTFGMRDYQRDRIRSFVLPESDPLGAGYQVRQSKIAVGSGALLGKGYMQGTQSQLRFLPARHTDFVFAVVAEESGFVGVLFVLTLYAMYLWRGTLIAARARDRPGVLLASGLLAVLCVHVLYNAAMVIGLVPVTGIPIPFLSYGGSFALFCFFVTGLVLGIDARRYVNRMV